VLTAVMLLMFAVYYLGLHEYARPDPLREMFLRMGAMGPVVYVVCFALWQTCLLPAAPFLLGGAITWQLPVAFATTWVGAVCAGIPVFILSRYVAQDWVRAHLPERAHRFDALLARNGIRAVVLLRLVFFTNPLLNPAIALSRIRFSEFVIGSAIGFLPGVVMWVVFGPRAVQWALAQPRSAWILGGVVLAVIATLVWIRQRRRTIAAASTSSELG